MWLEVAHHYPWRSDGICYHGDRANEEGLGDGLRTTGVGGAFVEGGGVVTHGSTQLKVIGVIKGRGHVLS